MTMDVIWRYMSIAKYVELLRSQSLYCPKASLFSDSTEGKWVAHAVLWGDRERWRQVREYADVLNGILDRCDGDDVRIIVEAQRVYDSLTPTDTKSVLGDVLLTLGTVFVGKRAEYLKSMATAWTRHHDEFPKSVDEWNRCIMIDRESTYVSCWSRARSMSLAMWELYGHGMESVALRSTVGKLNTLVSVNEAALAQQGLCGEVVDVEYVDGLTEPDGELQSSLIKRLGIGRDVRVGAFSVKPAIYQFENEVRLIVYNQRKAQDRHEDPCPEMDGVPLAFKGPKDGELNLSEYVDAVHIHPLQNARSMIWRVVNEINRAFRISALPIVVDPLEAIGSRMNLSGHGASSQGS